MGSVSLFKIAAMRIKERKVDEEMKSDWMSS
jgi:hypothetical protein